MGAFVGTFVGTFVMRRVPGGQSLHGAECGCPGFAAQYIHIQPIRMATTTMPGTKNAPAGAALAVANDWDNRGNGLWPAMVHGSLAESC